MNRKILVAGFTAIAFLVIVSCSEDNSCDLQCPPDCPDPSQAIDVLVVTALVYPVMADMIPGPLEDTGFLPAESKIEQFALLDTARALVIPTLEFLQQYDAILIFTDAWPIDNPGLGAFDTIGNLMADYVDAGGGLVICQYAVSGWSAGIRGRLFSPGYAPLINGPIVPGQGDRSIVMDSIDFPLHPVFYEIDLDGLGLPVDLHLCYPELDETAILLVEDDQGTNAMAINSNGNIIGLNMYFKPFAFPDDYTETVKLVANSILYVADCP